MFQRRAKLTALIVLIVTIGFIDNAQAVDNSRMQQTHSYIPANGFVPDEQTAIAIAEAVLAPIYGKQAIEAQKPYQVARTGDIWTVRGTLPRDRLGGEFLIEISKQTGQIMRVTHSK